MNTKKAVSKEILMQPFSFAANANQFKIACYPGKKKSLITQRLKSKYFLMNPVLNMHAF
jgi:hypothetical protein